MLSIDCIPPDPKSHREISKICFVQKIKNLYIRQPFRGTAPVGNPHYGQALSGAGSDVSNQVLLNITCAGAAANASADVPLTKTQCAHFTQGGSGTASYSRESRKLLNIYRNPLYKNIKNIRIVGNDTIWLGLG